MQTGSAVETQTFPKLLLRNASQYSSKSANRIKDLGIWHNTSWQQQLEQVRAFACGLAAKGVVRGQNVAVIGNNIPRLYWAVSAAQCLGCVPVPIHADARGKELSAILQETDIHIAVAQDQQQVDALLAVKESCPGLKEIVFLSNRGMGEYDRQHLLSYRDIQQLGSQFDADHPGFFDEVVNTIKADDPAIILYTSGATGPARGVVLSHQNLISTASSVANQEGLSSQDEILAFLPLAWASNILFTYAISMVTGCCLNCPESSDTIFNDMREIGPTFLFAPPHIYKYLVTMINTRIDSSRALDNVIFHYFSNVAIRVGNKRTEGKSASLVERLQLLIGQVLVFEPLKNVYGLSKVRVALTGGHPISPDVFGFFRTIGMDLRQTYGLTEASACVTIQPKDHVKQNTVGKPIAGMEYKLDGDGQVLIRGAGVMQGYYNNGHVSADALDSEGWLSSGDLGLVADNSLRIVDRQNDVGMLDNEQHFYPSRIESRLKSSAYIHEAIVFGDRRDAVVAFITIDRDAVSVWADSNNVRYTGYASLAANESVNALIKAQVSKVNDELAKVAEVKNPRISRFLILHRQLDEQSGELTHTRKLRREVIYKEYAPLIEALYSAQKTASFTDNNDQHDYILCRL